MSKKRTQSKKDEKKVNEFDINKYIPEKYQTIAAFGIILIIFLVYFFPMYFGGKTFQSGDIITAHSATSYLEKEHDGFTLWNPYIFCGMPAYAIAVGYKWFNLVYVAVNAARSIFTAFFSTEYAMWTFYLLMFSFTSYLLINYLTKNRLIGLIGGLATAFSTGILLFLLIGHVTKLVALGFFPLALLMILKLSDRFKLRDFAILIIAFQIGCQGWHVQIIFYELFAIGIYFLYFIIRYLSTKQKDKLIQIIKAGLTTAAAFLIALIIQSDSLTQIYQYNPYSTRGEKSIVEKQTKKETSGTDSDFYQYATNWSFSPGEVITFVIPSYYGFGNSTYDGPLTKGQPVEVNTYFGQMMTVDVPMYMGVIIFFLALFSIYANWKKPFVQYLTVLIIIALLISFGRTFPIIYNLMYDFFPYFDKFRVPSMILVLLQLAFPILAALGIQSIIDAKNNSEQKILNLVKYVAMGLSAVFVIVLVANSALSSSFTDRVNEYAAGIQGKSRQLAAQFNALADYMSSMFVSDIIFAFALSALAFLLLFAYIKSKTSTVVMLAGLAVLIMFDLFRIDTRATHYNEAQNLNTVFAEPDYIKIIKNQKDTQPFRLINMKQDGSLGSISQNANFNAYFLEQDFYGYSSIKPRAYQDLMDINGPANFNLWRMLNVKYVITSREATAPGLKLVQKTANSVVYENTDALPRTYFVDSAVVMPEQDIVKAVGEQGYDAKKIAYVDDQIKIDKPDSTTYTKVTSYKDEKIEIDAKASGNNLLFLGDTYYPNGWKAYIDNKETPILRVNHGFRGIIVPAGTHKIEFVYSPESFVIAKYLILIFSSLTFALLIAGIFVDRKKNNPGTVANS